MHGKLEPWEKRSNTKQDAFNKEANNRAEIFLAEQFCPTIKKELSLELGCDANIYIDENDKQTGTLKLIPPEYRFPALISDYEAMKDMLYGDIPSFDTIMESLRQLETEINSLS